MSKTNHDRLVDGLKSRAERRNGRTRNQFGYGIGLAEAQVARALDEMGDSEKYAMGTAGTRDSVLRGASGKLTYCQPDMVVTSKTTRASQFKAMLPEGIEVPENTLLVFQNVVTTPRVDRDKDVLETAGGSMDPKAPLLWQHVHTLPLGSVVATVEHTPAILRTACAIVDVNELTADAAKFVDAGVLRISHGFRALEWDQRKAEPGEAMGEPGFHITRFEVMEVSLVSVPSNVDAVIEMYASGKLASPVTKAWARTYHDSRQRVWPGASLSPPGTLKCVECDDVAATDSVTKAAGLFEAGVRNAKARIADGQVDASEGWEPASADDENAYVEREGIEAFAAWHLGQRDGADESTKAAWAYPFSSDFENVSRAALIAIRQRAAQAGDSDVFSAAGDLLESIDEGEPENGPDEGGGDAPPAESSTRPQRKAAKPSNVKEFDVELARLEASQLEFDWVSRFLSVEIKQTFSRDDSASGVWCGTLLAGLEEAILERGAKQVDLRNITDDGRESPPQYRHVQLNSTTGRSFVLEGLRFMRGADGHPFVVKTHETWTGVAVRVYSANADVAVSLIDRAWELGHAKNLLRYEAFSLRGDFLPKTAETFDGLFLTPENQKAMQRIVALVNDKGADLPNRGMILAGPPGTGKTLSSRVVRNQTNATFIWISARDFSCFGAYGTFGMAFDLAKALSPAILCFEDVDSWIDHWTVDLLKTELDGVARSTGIVTMLSTNFHDALPKALVDRPGRFHDVLMFDLPDDVTRGKMLDRWLPELTGDARGRTVELTRGYSGAHVYELCYFARVVGDEEQLSIEAAVEKAVAKIAQQRKLVGAKSGAVAARLTCAELRQKSTYRRRVSPTAVRENAAPPRTSKSPQPAEATAQQPPPKPADGVGAKAGRVLSEKNMSLLRECLDDMQELLDTEDLTRAGKALAQSCHTRLKSVIDSALPEVGPAPAGGETGKQSTTEQLDARGAFSLALQLSTPIQRRRWRSAIDAVIAADEDADLEAELEG